MNAHVHLQLAAALTSERSTALARRPSRTEAEAAIRTLIAYAGDDPAREGLAGTPERVARSFDEFYAGYFEDPVAIPQRTFEEIEGYDEMVLLKDIPFVSHCEHHLAQIANTIQHVLEPLGVGVVIEAVHHCMTTRGVNKAGVTMTTSTILGAFRDNSHTRREFQLLIRP